MIRILGSVTTDVFSPKSLPVDVRYKHYCDDVLLFLNANMQCEVVFLRDSCSHQAVVSREYFELSEYCETSEIRVLKGISGITLGLSLVQMRVDSLLAEGINFCMLYRFFTSRYFSLMGNDMTFDK